MSKGNLETIDLSNTALEAAMRDKNIGSSSCLMTATRKDHYRVSSTTEPVS